MPKTIVKSAKILGRLMKRLTRMSVKSHVLELALSSRNSVFHGNSWFEQEFYLRLNLILSSDSGLKLITFMIPLVSFLKRYFSEKRSGTRLIQHR